MSYAAYQELATAFARRCRERRNAEEEAQHELAELTKPATVSDVRKSNGAGAGLVYKTRDDACVADDNAGESVERTPSARTSSKQLWWQWTDERIESHLRAFGEEVAEKFGEAMAEFVGHKVDPIKRDLELTRRELTVLRHEVGVERGLRDLREEVATARKQIPKLPAIEARLGAEQTRLVAEQARLQGELDVTKEKLSKLRVNQSITDYGLRELEKQTAASKAGAMVMELETSTARFALRNIDPEAAKALREFASQVVDAEDGGAIWGRVVGLSSPAGT